MCILSQSLEAELGMAFRNSSATCRFVFFSSPNFVTVQLQLILAAADTIVSCPALFATHNTGLMSTLGSSTLHS